MCSKEGAEMIRRYMAAYDLGHEARQTVGINEKDNPYPSGSDDYAAWFDGYNGELEDLLGEKKEE